MSDRNDSSELLRKQWKPWLVGVAVLAVVIAGASWVKNLSGESTSESDLPVFEVKQGPLTISVTEAGTIQAREQVVIQSEVEGQTTIIFLVPEGTQVKQGDLLIELDGSRLVDEKVDQEIRVQNAEAAFIRARENLEVVKNQALSDIDKAELAYEFAQQDLQKYVEGEYPKDLKEAQSKISLASEELQRAEEKLNWSKILFSELYLSQMELQADELAANKARLDLELAVTNLELLKDYTYKRDLASLESDVKQAEMALERTRRKANADVVQAEADLRAKDSEFKRQQDKLDKNEEQIIKTRMYAPKEGMVVYATSAQASWRGNAEPLEEGQQVRERQELIYLPTADSFKAEVKVHESSMDKISRGLPVRITVDALPGRVFPGEVVKIAPLPDAQSVFLNPDLKVYKTEIHVTDDTHELRTGMSCQAEIIVTRYSEALYVPIQAVLKVGGKHCVYIMHGKSMEQRTVEIGFDNNRMVHVTSGLKPGEKVLLTPPLAPAARESEEGEVPIEATQPQGEKRPDAVPAAGDRESEPAGPPRDTGPAQDAPRDWRSMTDEQRQEMRRRFETMSDEERQQLRQQWTQGGDASRRSSSEEGRGRRSNLTPEQREEMRKRFENMSPEEREAMRQRRSRGREENPQEAESSP